MRPILDRARCCYSDCLRFAVFLYAYSLLSALHLLDKALKTVFFCKVYDGLQTFCAKALAASDAEDVDSRMLAITNFTATSII